jgi:hypothetical protein
MEAWSGKRAAPLLKKGWKTALNFARQKEDFDNIILSFHKKPFGKMYFASVK